MNMSSAELAAKLEDFKTAILIARGREALCKAEMELDNKVLMSTLQEVMVASRRVTPKVNSKSILEIAKKHSWTVREVDRVQGNYFGMVVAVDSFGCFVQIRTNEVIELEFNDLAAGQKKPSMGDSVRMQFKSGKLWVSVRPKGQ